MASAASWARLAILLAALLATSEYSRCYGQALRIETVLEGLDTISAIAALPGARGKQQSLFLLDANAEELLLYTSDLSGEARSIYKFEEATPVALAIVGADNLLVAMRSPSGETKLQIFSVADQTNPLLRQTIDLPAESLGEKQSNAAMRLAMNERYVYLAMGAQVMRARHNAGMLGKPRLHANVAEVTEITALAFSDKRYLVALATPTDSAAESEQLLFLDPIQSKRPARAVMPCGLTRTLGLSYGAKPRPTSRLLYALGHPPGSPDLWGLYRLDAALDENREMACQPVLIESLPQTTAVSMASDGALYLATNDGKLLRLSGEL